MAALRIAIAGSGGRMGRMLVEAVLESPDLCLVGAAEAPGNPALGQDAGGFCGKASGVNISAELGEVLRAAEVFIDFTRPVATLAYLSTCRAAGVNMVIGTTGFDEPGRRAIADAARDIGIVCAPNMSVGVNLAFKLVEMAARVLGDDYDVEIIEAHHRYKVDAPSGTALRLGEVAAAALGRNLAEDAVYDRTGVTGERKASSIGFSTIRGGDMVGDHTVLFAGTGERVEITHRSSSRATYADGALRAARFLGNHGKGLYDMQQVLGLNG
jgi:4-hydroxy-tetrahydrodipicolinate reductase